MWLGNFVVLELEEIHGLLCGSLKGGKVSRALAAYYNLPCKAEEVGYKQRFVDFRDRDSES